MKSIKIITLILTAFLFSFYGYAQEELFKVLASSGQNEVVTNEGSSKVTIGKSLYQGDKVKVASGGYLGLAHKSGKTIELKKPGSYTLSELSKQVEDQNKGVCKKYVDFMVGEMTSQDEDISKNKYKYMAVTGSVERPSKPVIKSFLPGDAKVLKGEIELSWIPIKNEKEYLVTLTNLFQDTVYSQIVLGNNIKIDLTKLELEKEKIYKWSVEGKGKSTEFTPRVIRAMTNEEEKALKDEIVLIKDELKEENALNKFVMANVYAEKGLIIDAISCYQEAIRMAPDVETYQIAFGRFLEEQKLGQVDEDTSQK